MEGLAKLGFDLKGIVFYMVNFGVVLWVINKFVFTPLIAWADARRKSIHDNLEAAEQIKETYKHEFQKQESEHKQYIEKLRTEYEQSQAQAEQKAREIITEAEAERQRILAKAKDETASLKTQIRQELESELISKVTKIVTTSLRTGVTPETAAVIVENMWRETP
jgi:F-type H+-transporting ATPase subunit b